MNCKVLKNLVSLISVLSLLILGAESTFFEERPIHISYSPNDPYFPPHWTDLCKNGLKQSPVIYDDLQYIISPPTNEPKLTMIGGVDLKPSHIRVVNNGYGVYFEFIYDNLQAPRIFGGPLDAALYKFQGFSYHIREEHKSVAAANWGDLELQFLHYNMKYKSVDEAKDKDDGLAVISVRYRESTNPSSTFPTTLLSAIETVSNPYTETALSTGGFTYAEALGFVPVQPIPSHYFYEGSITVPPCYESVKWFIVKETFTISDVDLERFKNIQLFSGNQNNNRFVKVLGSRTVTEY